MVLVRRQQDAESDHSFVIQGARQFPCSTNRATVVKDRILAILCFSTALILMSGVIIGMLVGLIEWLQGGSFNSISVLEAAYEMGLRARHLQSLDWGWRLRGWLDAIPLPFAAIVMAPLFWWVGLIHTRR